MKDFKHQLLEQLEDSDILEEFKRRKLKVPGSQQERNKLDPYSLNLIVQISLFVFTVILIILFMHLAS